MSSVDILDQPRPHQDAVLGVWIAVVFYISRIRPLHSATVGHVEVPTQEEKEEETPTERCSDVR